MTPKPNNLPAPADMTLQQLIREVARILDNSGGPERGAEYSAALAAEALRRAENLPGWRKIETAPMGLANRVIVAVPTEISGEFVTGEAYFDPNNGEWWWAGTLNGEWGDAPISDINHGPPMHWYDFGGGAPMPPVPVEGVEE